MPQLQPVNLDIFTVTAQPVLQTSNDKHDSKPEEDRKVRETTIMEKTGVDATTTFTSPAEDAVKSPIPATPEAIVEQPH